jgi:ubiquinone/menaquinone biosynthesis C-methylase UbiE
MQRLRETRSLPGISSPAVNREIWQSWDWSQGGDEWTPSADWKEAFRRGVLERYVPAAARVLEIGPGAGRWTGYLAERAAQLTAVDISSSCIELCREKFGHLGNVEFLVTSGEALPGVPDTAIDCIFSFDVFVHINRREVGQYVAEFRRVLKPGGRGIIHHGNVAGAGGGWRSDLTGREFTALLEQAGLRVHGQFATWDHAGHRFDVSRYGDLITVFEK